VQTMWPREQDFTHDIAFRPMALVRVKMGMDASGNVAMAYRTVGPGIGWRALGPQESYPPAGTTKADSASIDGAAKSRYGFTARRVEHVPLPAMVPIGYWRSVGASINPYAVECTIDALAEKVGQDPFAFRQWLVGPLKSNDGRVRRLLSTLDSLSAWRNSLPPDHAWGMAFAEAFGTLICQVVDVSEPVAGTLRVHRVACAVDCGVGVNPSYIESQIQGSIAYGMSAALWSQQVFDMGRPQRANFDTNRMVRANDMPAVTVAVVNSGEAVGGIGELGVPPIGPAIANAYYRLTKARTGVGTRFFSLPFYP
jgi:isoquinoline 1-oxidoreductase beta subunit